MKTLEQIFGTGILLSVLLASLFPAHLWSQEGGVRQSDSATSIGLNVGDRAPMFSSRDQFGRTESNATLKGPNGTILLFFRSADW